MIVKKKNTMIMIGIIFVFLGVYLYIFGFSLLVDPDFNHDLGNPTAWQRWYVGETQFNITLIEILKKPDRAVLGYQNNTYIVEQFETIKPQFTIRIF